MGGCSSGAWILPEGHFNRFPQWAKKFFPLEILSPEFGKKKRRGAMHHMPHGFLSFPAAKPLLWVLIPAPPGGPAHIFVFLKQMGRGKW
jgi:hypothetical protein